MKKFSLIALCALLSMLFFVVSCGSSEDEDAVDTETEDSQTDTQSDTGTTDPTDTADTTDPTDQTDDPTNPTNDPTNPTDDPTNPTDDPTNPTDNPTDPTDPTDPTNPGEGSDGNLNTGDTSGNQAQSGATGAPCTSDSQCTGTYSGSYGGENYDQEAFCLTQNDDGFVDGYCSFMCDATDHQACDNAGGVYHGYNSWGDGYCFHKCTKPSDCRVGYRCSNKIHACMPDCKAVGYECAWGQCDETDGVCL